MIHFERSCLWTGIHGPHSISVRFGPESQFFVEVLIDLACWSRSAFWGLTGFGGFWFGKINLSFQAVREALIINKIFRNRIRIHSSGYEPFAAFSAAVFSFLSSNSTYLYCTVRLCRAQSSNCNSSCGATASSWKQKRSTSIDEPDEINLKLGPLLINNQKSKSGFHGQGRTQTSKNICSGSQIDVLSVFSGIYDLYYWLAATGGLFLLILLLLGISTFHRRHQKCLIELHKSPQTTLTSWR